MPLGDPQALLSPPVQRHKVKGGAQPLGLGGGLCPQRGPTGLPLPFPIIIPIIILILIIPYLERPHQGVRCWALPGRCIALRALRGAAAAAAPGSEPAPQRRPGERWLQAAAAASPSPGALMG